MAKSKWEDVKNKFVLIEGWCRDGLTEAQIIKNLGISKDTFYTYKKTHTEFSDLLKRSKEVVDFEVENALLKKALAGDVTAQIFWLKNRKRDSWREKHEVNIGGQKDAPIEIKGAEIDLSSLNDKELEELESIIAKTSKP